MYEIVLSHQDINFFSSAFCRSRVHPKNLFAWLVFPPNLRSDRAYLPFLFEKYRRKAFRLLFDISHSSFRQIGAVSFAKARISERNDRRDKRRPQIYVSLESWDGEYLECTMFFDRWSFCIAKQRNNFDGEKIYQEIANWQWVYNLGIFPLWNLNSVYILWQSQVRYWKILKIEKEYEFSR